MRSVAAFNDMVSRPGPWVSLALFVAGCAHTAPAGPPTTTVAADPGPAPDGWLAGPALPSNVLSPSSVLDEANGLLHIVTASGVDVVRVADGSTVWSAKMRPLWVGSLDGRTRVFALSSERAAVVELEPKSGQSLRSWSGAGAVQPGLSRVEGGALVVELVAPTFREPNGVERPAPPAAPPPPARMFVPLDREGAVAFHRGTLAPSPEKRPALPEVRAEAEKLWLVPAGGAPPVLLLDPSPPPGYPTTMFVDPRQVVLLVTNASGSETVWQLHDATDGTLRARLPHDRCSSAPRLVGEVILCERASADRHQEIAALDPRTLETRWAHATLPLPMPTPYSAAGSTR